MSEISIIVPVYNAEEFLGRCVESILSQTYTDFEVILVNDGSTDTSLSVCEEFEKKDGRIKVISKENGGISSARNAGIKAAQGTYLMFCDGDDVVFPEWCERLLKTAKRHPDALVTCAVAFSESGDLKWNSVMSEETPISYLDLFKLGASQYVSNKIFRADIVKENAIEFDESFRIAQDVGFVVRYCGYCPELFFLNEKLYCFVENEDGMMKRYFPDRLEMNLEPFFCRTALLSGDELTEYCDIWLYPLYNMLDNVFDERNTEMTFSQKMNFNRRMVKSPQFMFCVDNASGKNESPRFMKLLRKHNYDLIRLFQKITGAKK